MLARRPLASAADGSLQRGTVHFNVATERDVVYRDAGVLTEQIVGRFGHLNVMDHGAENFARLRRRLALRECGEATLDVVGQDLERPDVKVLGDVFDDLSFDAHRG